MGEMRSSRERAFSTQTIINSESYHRVEEGALKEKAEGVMRPDTDRWGSAKGKFELVIKEAIPLPTLTLPSMADSVFLGSRGSAVRKL